MRTSQCISIKCQMHIGHMYIPVDVFAGDYRRFYRKLSYKKCVLYVQTPQVSWFLKSLAAMDLFHTLMLLQQLIMGLVYA